MSKRLAEQKCSLLVKFKDTSGKIHEAIIVHTGDDDSWDGVTIIEVDNTEKAFDFNTYDGKVFGTDGKLHVAGYQCSEKGKDGAWEINLENQIDIISFKRIK